jgi:hypothetical protein
MAKFTFSRTKMGTQIDCVEINGCYILRHNGKMIHATSEDLLNDDVAAEAAFFTAWNMVTGFEPFNVVRRLSNGKFKHVGNTTFVPAGKKVVSVKADWHRVSVKYK